MPNKLSHLNIQEVALCHRGMNKHARVALFKASTPEDEIPYDEIAVEAARLAKENDDPVSFREALRAQLVERMGWEISDKLWPIFDAFRTSIINTISNIESEEQRAAQLEINVRDFLDAAQNAADDVPVKSEPNGGNTMTIEELQAKLEGMEKSASAMRNVLFKAGYDITEGDDGSITITDPAPQEFITIDGEQVNKADVPAPLLKRIEADRARLEKLEKAAEITELSKQAEELFPNLAGTATQKGALLKSINAIEDEDTRKAVHESLKAADASAKAAFDSVGKTGSDGDGDGAVEKLNKAAKEYAVEKGVPFESGFAAFVKTAEGRKLRAEAEAERRGN